MMRTYPIFLFFMLSFHSVLSQQDVGDNCRISRSGENGVCRFFTDCPEVTRRLQQEKIRPTICGFQSSRSIVCCPGQQITTTTSRNIPRPPSNVNRESSNSFGSRKRVSERKCDEYSSQVKTEVSALPLLPDSEPITFSVAKCEYSNVPLIVGGEEADVGEFPHMAVLGWPLVASNDYAWNCGGSLISDEFVLTAGHCISNSRDSSVSSAEPTIVRLGEHNLKSTRDGAEPQDIRIARIIKHPDYKPPAKYNDIALLKLASKARLNKFVRPACLWQKPTFTQQKAIATGWGRIEYAEEPSDVLRRVSINIIEQDVCRQLYSGRNRYLQQGISNKQMCAGDLEGGKDTCQGDSGGPLQISSNENQCIFYIIGVTSFGRSCALADKPGVYTKVNEYVSWIEGEVWPGQ